MSVHTLDLTFEDQHPETWLYEYLRRGCSCDDMGFCALITETLPDNNARGDELEIRDNVGDVRESWGKNQG